jgi:hypothetical protein
MAAVDIEGGAADSRVRHEVAAIRFTRMSHDEDSR